jgi:outer membrane protein assembly factor BamB
MMRTLILSMFFFPATVQAEPWAGWRGPGNHGISKDKGFPIAWSKTENVKWKTEVRGAGVSVPVVWGDRVFLTASEGRLNDQLHVYAFARKDGNRLWDTRLFGSAPTDLYPPGGMAVPTPATDGKLLFVLFGTGDLAALDFDGKPVWIRSLAEEYGPFRNRWGMGASPILVGDTLIVQVDHWSQSYLLAVDSNTGKNRWKTDRTAAVNWSTPLAVDTRDGKQIVTIGTHYVRGYDLNNGAEMWSVEGTHQQCIPSPVVMGDLVLACSGVNTMAIKLDGSTGDITKSNVVWKNTKAAAFLPSPLLYGEHLYLPLDKGFALCLDAKTGQQLWRERLGDAFHASPVGAEGRVYFFSKSGIVNVVKAGPKFEELSRNDMGEEVVAGPAFSDGEIFIRGAKHLFCIGK